MKKYRIKLNDEIYEIEVEEIGESEEAITKIEEKKAVPVVTEKKEPVKKSASNGEEAVTAPMPGAIVEIKVSEGERVKAGQVLLILEAMKMENEIVAPKDGQVISISASKGSSVASGDTLVLLG